MKRQERKQVFNKMLLAEFDRRPDLKRSQKIYTVTRLVWVIFSLVYAALTVCLLVYTNNHGLIMSSLIIPVAALFCIYFLNDGIKGILFITFFGGMFELFRGYLMFGTLQENSGRVATAYVICVIIQGMITLGITLFMLLSHKIGAYLSCVKYINREINNGRY